MYEDYSKKRKLKINWKSLLFKLVILLIVVFLIMLLVSLVKKKDDNKKVESNFKTNFSYMQTTAKDYFKGSKLPTNINGRKKVTLGELIKENAIIEFKDQNNKACDMVESFIEATKVSETEYTIKTKLTCGIETDYVIDNIKVEVEQNNNAENNDNQNTSAETDNKNNTNQTTNKPNTNKPNTKPNTNKPSSNINYVNTSPNTEVKTCSYGDKSYDTNNVVAYFIPGDCAVAISEYHNGNYANKASSIGSAEYSKLYAEIVALEKYTGVSLDIEAPSYSPVYNKVGTGLVGYKILFAVRVKNTNNIVYEYYIDTNSNRKVVMDYRNSLYNYNNSNNTSNTLNAISMNTYRLNLNVGDSYKLSVNFYPSTVTNKNISWTSTNSGIVSVDNNGNIIAKRTGSVNIIARVDGKSTSTFVIVK